MTRRANKLTVLLTEDEYERLDTFCQEQGFKKSTLTAKLIRDFLDSKRFMVQSELPFQVPNAKI